jgi:hypothetical protein
VHSAGQSARALGGGVCAVRAASAKLAVASSAVTRCRRRADAGQELQHAEGGGSVA